MQKIAIECVVVINIDIVCGESDMKIDDSTKIISMISVIMGMMISAAGYFADQKIQAAEQKLQSAGLRLQSLEASINELKITEKTMDISKKEYDLSARLMVDFSLPLARSFALQYFSGASLTDKLHKNISIPKELASEFTEVLPGWKKRKGLMTGSACRSEGLKTRQVVTLRVRNIGHTDAINIILHAKQKKSPHKSPKKSWQELSNEKPLSYSDLLLSTNEWERIIIPIKTLHGQGTFGNENIDMMEEQIVLASVSGTTSLFGTIIVPLEVSWTDNISKKTHTLPILSSNASRLRQDLIGAEIGSVSAKTCGR